MGTDAGALEVATAPSRAADMDDMNPKSRRRFTLNSGDVVLDVADHLRKFVDRLG